MQPQTNGQSAAVTAQPTLSRFPGNGTYNARRFDAARKALADALAAPVFTDAERARALVNAWNSYSLHELIKWTRNVQRVAAERAVAQAKQRTAEQAAEGRALLEARWAIQALVNHSPAFSNLQRQQAVRAAWNTPELPRLRRWLRNLKRLRDEREEELWVAVELGFPTGPLSDQRGLNG